LQKSKTAIFNSYLGSVNRADQVYNTTDSSVQVAAESVRLDFVANENKPLLPVKAGPLRSKLLGSVTSNTQTFIATLPRSPVPATSFGRLKSGSLDLDRFDFFDSSSYVFTHTGLNVFVLIVLTVALTAIAFSATQLWKFAYFQVYVAGLIILNVLKSLEVRSTSSD